MRKFIIVISMIIASCCAFATSLTDGLVGYWPFDGDAKDYSGNENHGTKHGVSLTADRHGNSNGAYKFGEGKYISVAANKQLNDISDFSLCAWVKVASWYWDCFAPVACKGEKQFGLEIANEQHEWVRQNNANCVFEVNYQIGGAYVFSSAIVPTGEWMHVGISRDGRTITAYVNGVSIGSSNAALGSDQKSGDLDIGRDVPGSVEYLLGSMDEVFLYNRALSSSEMSALYNGALRVCTIAFDECGGDDVKILCGKEQKLPKNTYRKDGYVFQGWAKSKSDADNGIVEYQDEEEITIESDMTLYAVWQASLPDVVVHFNANGGVFRDKDGNEVTQFDQYFSYGEAQRLFTDELTPMKMDADGNQFVGWVRESPEVTTGSSIVAAREERTWHEHDGVTEVTYYAVWTTTVTVSFYNDTDVNSGNRILSPGSLGNHLSWSVDDDAGRYKGGESVQVLPGQRIIRLYVDDEYHWIAGRFDLGIDEPYFNRTYDYLELNIGNDFSDALIYGSTPREYVRRIYVEVGPDISQPETHGDVVFFYSAAVREELRGLINAQRGNVPAFDVSKVRISIGRTEVNQSGIVVWDLAHGLTGLELRKYYCLPTGIYYLKDVVYDADKGSGDPYWGAVIDSTFQNQLIEVKDGKITERTINFDVFGGANVARAVFDPREGACAKSEAWFPYYSSQYSAEGIRIVSKRALPTPERAGFRFMGWFTKESGGIEIKEGATMSGDKVCWNLPDDLGSFDYTFKVYAQWTDMTDKWVNELFPDLVFDQSDDIVTLAKTMAANGTRTVAQCYSCGVNPTDPNDDLKIADFEMKDGKPVITLNHTEDGSGNSFLPRVKTLGKATLSDAEEWREVPEEGDQSMRFFKVEVEMP